MNYLKSATFLIPFLALACAQEPQPTDGDLAETLQQIDEKFDDLEVPYQTIESDPKFTLEIPVRMLPQTTLNQEADIQYAYAARVGNITEEHYLIVLSHNKDSILLQTPDADMKLESYAELAVNNIGHEMDEYEVLNVDTGVQKINGLDCIKYKMKGADGFGDQKVSIYYQLGVFSGKEYFYQVLTWTLQGQEDQFKGSMERIINSFKESES